MKIKKVRISNYRSIKDAVELDFSNLTALVGPNNSGKSNILWCINKILGQETDPSSIFTEKDVYKQDPNRDIDVEITLNKPLEHIPYDGALPAYIDKLRFIYKRHKEGPLKGTRTLEQYCLTKDNRMVQVLAEPSGAGSTHIYKTLECPLQKIREMIPVVYIRTDRITTQSRVDIRQQLLNSLLDKINCDFLREDNTILIMNADGTESRIPRKQWFEQCINEAMITLRTRTFDELKETIRKSMMEYLGTEIQQEEALWDIYFKPLTSLDFYHSLEMCFIEGDHITPLRALGEGVQNAIVLSILHAYNKQNADGFVLMMEEPEMYMHPRMKRSLFRVLNTLSEKNQVIYVTHSTYMVSLPHFDSVRMIHNDGEGTKAKAPHNENAPMLKAYFSNIISHELNELFFTKKVLLVENLYEKRVLLNYQARLELDYDTYDVAILVVGNKQDMLHLSELALAFDMNIAIGFEWHSGNYKERREEEEEMNKHLVALEEKGVTVFYTVNNYEEYMRNEWGEETFQSYVEKYAGKDNYQKMMYFTTDPEIPIPSLVQTMISWITAP